MRSVGSLVFLLVWAGVANAIQRRQPGIDAVTVADQMAAAAEAHVSAAAAIKEAAEALKETASSLKAGAQEVADSAAEEEALKNAVRTHIAQSSNDLDKLENAVMSEPSVAAPCPSPPGAPAPAAGAPAFLSIKQTSNPPPVVPATPKGKPNTGGEPAIKK